MQFLFSLFVYIVILVLEIEQLFYTLLLNKQSSQLYIVVDICSSCASNLFQVYKKCQEFEQKRIEFFKKTFFQIHQCLDLSVDAKYVATISNDHHLRI